MTRLGAVLLDLDGTLTDSVPDIAAALNEALIAARLSPLEEAHVKTMVGGGARRLVEAALLKNGHHGAAVDFEAVLESFLDAYRAKPARLTRLYPGTREALETWRRRGLKLGVVTNKPLDLTTSIIRALGLSSLFEVIVGSEPGLALKPSPDPILKAVNSLGCSPAAALMVGDSVADLGAARAAGCRMILLAHGYSNEPVAGLGADWVAADFAALMPLVDSLCAGPSRAC